MPTSNNAPDLPERRRRLRFPLETELRYSRRGGSATRIGQVVDISSRGLAFRADGPLETGWRLSVSMAWPAKLDHQTLLRLVFEGVVVRTKGDLVVVTIDHAEFRTAGKCTTTTREEIAAMVSGIDSLVASRGVPGAGSAYPQRLTP